MPVTSSVYPTPRTRVRTSIARTATPAVRIVVRVVDDMAFLSGPVRSRGGG